MNTVSLVVPELIASGSYSNPWLGITGLQVVMLGIIRDGEEEAVEVTLEARPAP